MQDLGQDARLQLKGNQQQPNVAFPGARRMPAVQAVCCGMGLPVSLTMRGHICVQRESSMGAMAYTCLIDAASAVEPGRAGLMPRIHERNSSSPALPKV